ncbi:6-bladed beta-propeller [Aquiflexum sp. TKW24L]|nr:6-bladed beta-propeller [Aquiflexum sp. TKW24L]
MKGNFLNILGKSGDGPGEYGIIYSVAIDHSSGLIYVASERKLQVYNSNLQFIKEKKFPILLQYISILNNRPIIISETLGTKVFNGFANQTNLFELDSDLKIVDSLQIRNVVLPERIISGYPFKHYISVVEKDNFLYKPVLTPENLIRDTLYKINGKELIPHIKLKFEKPQSLNSEGFKITNVYNIVNSKSYLFCEYENENQIMLFLFDRKKKVGYNLKGGIRDSDGEKVLLRPLDLSKDIFYFVKEVKYENSKTEESNPIIGIVKLK